MQFTVFGKVHGKARPRFSTRNGYAQAFDPKSNREYEGRIRSAFIEAGGKSTDRPVSIEVVTFRALPKSRPKRVESEADTFKPDIDNVLKIVLDALNGVAYEDDSQVVRISGRKMPRTRRSEEALRVEIEEVDS